jgi:hypothetical protein
MTLSTALLELGLSTFSLPNAKVNPATEVCCLSISGLIALKIAFNCGRSRLPGFRVVDRLIQSAHDQSTSSSHNLDLTFSSNASSTCVKSISSPTCTDSRAETAHFHRICAITKRCDVCTHISRLASPHTSPQCANSRPRILFRKWAISPHRLGGSDCEVAESSDWTSNSVIPSTRLRSPRSRCQRR